MTIQDMFVPIKIASLLLICALPLSLWAQPANDNCAAAIPLVLQQNTCQPQVFTNAGATTAGDPAKPACWANNLTATIWFSFEATGTAARISTHFDQTTVNTRIAVYSGTCGSLTLVSCNDNISVTDGHLKNNVLATNLTPGQTYYIMVDTDGGTGNIAICAEEIPNPAGAGTLLGAGYQDCTDAFYVINTSNISIAPGSFGAGSQEPAPCFGADGEQNSIWLKVYAQTAGQLYFTATPTVGTTDLDFAVYDATNGCLGLNIAAPHGCSVNTGTAPDGTVGWACPVPAVCATQSCNNTLSCPTGINMAAGRTYAIMIDRKAASTGVTVSFPGIGGGPGQSTLVPSMPRPSFLASTECLGNPVQFTNFSRGRNMAYTWDFGDGSTSSIANPSYSYKTAGTYTVNLILTELNTGATRLSSQQITIGAGPTVHTLPKQAMAAEDTIVCANEPVSLRGTAQAFDATSPADISFFNFNSYEVLPEGPGTTGARSEVNVSQVFPATVNSSSIKSVCFTIATTQPRQIRIELECPNGAREILFTGNKLAGRRWFEGTCVEAGAAAWASAPGGTGSNITGTYAIENGSNAWNNVLGCEANGTWKLIVRDTVTGFPAALLDWSITFNTQNPTNEIVDIIWEAEDGTAVNASPPALNGATASSQASAVPQTSTRYIMRAFDLLGCSNTDTVRVRVAGANISVAKTDVTLPGGCDGTASGSATGDYPPFTFQWLRPNGTLLNGPSITGLCSGTYKVYSTDARGCRDSALYTIFEPGAGSLLLNSNFTHPLCNGNANGTIQISPGAGLAPLTYTWSGPIPLTSGINVTNQSGLPAGQYKCVVTDFGGIKDSVLIDLVNPQKLQVFLTGSTPVSCHGGSNGSATVDASGGVLGPNSGYRFFWKLVSNNGPIGQFSRTATNLTARAYWCVVQDDNNCKDSVQVVITQPAQPLAATAGATTPVSCAGSADGSASVTASGGTPGYFYLWTPGNEATASVTNKPAGTYTVRVRDSRGCETTINTTIGSPAPLNVSMGTITQVSCFGGNNGSAQANASGGSGTYTYTFLRLPLLTPVSSGPASSISGLSPGDYRIRVTDGNNCRDSATFTITEPTALEIAFSQINPTLAGGTNGSITLEAAGGTPPYNYSWKLQNGTPISGSQATRSGLGAGSYWGIVTDNRGCQDSALVTLVEPGILQVSVSATNAQCPGQSNGSAEAFASGGTTPYSFAWEKLTNLPEPLFSTNPTGAASEAATGLNLGTWQVTVTDGGGATATTSFSIGENTGLTPQMVKTDISCNGANNGSASANPNGGTAPFQYTWTGPGGYTSTLQTIENLLPGIYTVAVTDVFGCSGGGNVTIAEPATPLQITSINKTDLSCFESFDGTLQANVTGGTPNTVGPAYNYIWERAASPLVYTTATVSNLPADAYTLTVTDANGCQVQQTIVLNQPADISITANITAVTCQGGNNGALAITATGGNPGAKTYLWEPGGMTTPGISNLKAGIYKVVVRDPTGCADSAFFTIPENPGITVNIQQTNVSCNGSNNGEVIVRASGGMRLAGPSPYTYGIAPASGTQLQDSIFQGLTPGTYTLSVTDALGCVSTLQTIVSMPEVLTLVTTQTSAAAGGGTNGTASVLIQGGTAPYTIDWSNDGTGDFDDNPTITGLVQGNYTVVVRDANGCTRSANIMVTETAGGPLQVTRQATDATCDGQTNGTAALNVTGGQPPYAFNWVPAVSTTSYATGLIPGVNYSVTVTDAGGAVPANINFTIGEPAPLELVVPNLSLTCFGNPGALEAFPTGGTPPYRYRWVSSQFIGEYTTKRIEGLTAGNYVVTVTDNNNCTISTTARVNTPERLRLSVSFVTNNDCFDDNTGGVIITPTGGTQCVTPAQPYAYNWIPGGMTTGTVSNLKAGTYKVIVSDCNNCQDSATVQVNQPGRLEMRVNVTNVACGGGQSGAAGVHVTGGTPSYSYLWKNLTNPAFQVLGTDTASNLPAGIYRVVVTDANQCQDSINFQIFQPKALQVAATRKPVSCHNGGDGALFALGSGGIPGPAGYHFTWKNAQTGQTLGTGTEIDNLSPGLYRVVIADDRGCRDSTQITLENPPRIRLDRQVTNNLCRGGSAGIVRVIPSGGNGGFTYQWEGSSVTTATRSGLAEGSYKVRVFDAAGCVDSATFTLTDPPAVSFDNIQLQPSSGTNNGTATVLAVSNVADPSMLSIYDLDNPTGSPLQTTAAAAAPYPAFTGLAAGNYRIVLTDNNGCRDSTDIEILQGELSIEDIIAESCSGHDGSATVRARPTLVTTPITYRWYRMPARQLIRTQNSNSLTDILAGQTAGQYRVVIQDAVNYRDSVDFSIPQGPRLQLRPDYAECLAPSDPVNTTLDLESPAPMLGTNPATGSWAAFDRNFAPIGGLSGTQLTITTQGIFYAVFTETSTGCQDTVSLFFGELDAGPDTIACLTSNTGTFQVAAPFGVGTWTASDPNVTVLNAQTGLFDISQLSPPTIFTATLTAAGGGCSDDLDVIVERGPTVRFGTLPELPSAILFIPAADVIVQNLSDLNGATGDCIWDMGDGTILTGCQDRLVHRYQQPGNYNICLTIDAGNCAETFCIENIIVANQSSIKVPGVITPNGDGINDRLVVETLNIISYELTIRNRWGQLVFSTTDPANHWDGRIKNGNDAPSGVYFWVIKAKDNHNQVIHEAGNVTILR
ncbi:MAG: gliding motility-associated C-terminal domain-containing protein [Bacteroidetes bacterium]|nr:gliding motility-associated C-terminal domain-containing protein [Bacteroidota bacterium]